jgi:methionyl-tRNA formyltransferase
LTTFFIKHEIDTGNIIFFEEVDIQNDDDAGSLHDRLMIKGGELVLKTVKAVEAGNYTLTVQHDSLDLKKAPKIFREMCKIDWKEDSKQIRNFVRGLSPFPGAWTILNGKLYKIFKVEVLSEAEVLGEVGSFLTDSASYLKVQCLKGIVSIVELQPEGKKRMTIRDFFRGNSI